MAPFLQHYLIATGDEQAYYPTDELQGLVSHLKAMSPEDLISRMLLLLPEVRSIEVCL